jgi:hypothetical protein
MASFTGVDDTTSVVVRKRGTPVKVALSGTYNMTIALQVENGSPGSGVWVEVARWSTANATVAYTYNTIRDLENVRLIVLVDTSGTCVAVLTDVSDLYLVGSATLVKEYHAGRTVLMNIAGGLTVTLPASKGPDPVTGKGDIYKVFVLTTLTSAGIIKVASAADIFAGGVHISTDIGGVTLLTAADSDTITMDG